MIRLYLILATLLLLSACSIPVPVHLNSDDAFIRLHKAAVLPVDNKPTGLQWSAPQLMGKNE